MVPPMGWEAKQHRAAVDAIREELDSPSRTSLLPRVLTEEEMRLIGVGAVGRWHRAPWLLGPALAVLGALIFAVLPSEETKGGVEVLGTPAAVMGGVGLMGGWVMSMASRRSRRLGPSVVEAIGDPAIAAPAVYCSWVGGAVDSRVHPVYVTFAVDGSGDELLTGGIGGRLLAGTGASSGWVAGDVRDGGRVALIDPHGGIVVTPCWRYRARRSALDVLLGTPASEI